MIYADTGKWQPVQEPLYDPVLEISGKPDYLIKQGNQITPVEVKSGKTPEAPYDSHIFQLAVYCALVEKNFGVTPTHGIIHYPEKTFRVGYTTELQIRLVELIKEIQSNSRKRSMDRSHHEPGRCRNCGFRQECDQSLV